MQDMDVPAGIKDADSTREAQLLESWKAYKTGFQEGIALFNKKPKKGIAFMQVRFVLLLSHKAPLLCPAGLMYVQIAPLRHYTSQFLPPCSCALSVAASAPLLPAILHYLSAFPD